MGELGCAIDGGGMDSSGGAELISAAIFKYCFQRLFKVDYQQKNECRHAKKLVDSRTVFRSHAKLTCFVSTPL